MTPAPIRRRTLAAGILATAALPTRPSTAEAASLRVGMSAPNTCSGA